MVYLPVDIVNIIEDYKNQLDLNSKNNKIIYEIKKRYKYYNNDWNSFLIDKYRNKKIYYYNSVTNDLIYIKRKWIYKKKKKKKKKIKKNIYKTFFQKINDFLILLI